MPKPGATPVAGRGAAPYIDYVKTKGVIVSLALAGMIQALAANGDPFPAASPPPAGPLTAPTASNGKATDLIGESVTGREGQNIGTLSDIVFDMRDGRVAFGVVKTLEDERKIAVPAALLKAKPEGHSLAMGCSEQHFRASSDFAKNDLRDPSWEGATYAYFGLPQPEQQMATADGPVIVEAAGAELSQFTAPAKSAVAAAATPIGKASSFARWSDLAANAVEDKDGHPVGDIRDAVIDWVNGHMLYAILDASGIDGLKHRYIAIAPGALQPSAAGGCFVVKVTKSELASAPSFASAPRPGAADHAFVESVNHFYSQAR
jgi:sporulation protein YlmC with PRC-barrel domain